MMLIIDTAIQLGNTPAEAKGNPNRDTLFMTGNPALLDMAANA